MNWFFLYRVSHKIGDMGDKNFYFALMKGKISIIAPNGMRGKNLRFGFLSP